MTESAKREKEWVSIIVVQSGRKKKAQKTQLLGEMLYERKIILKGNEFVESSTVDLN